MIIIETQLFENILKDSEDFNDLLSKKHEKTLEEFNKIDKNN